MTSDTTVQLPRFDDTAVETFPTAAAAGLGVVGVVLGYLTLRHYVYVEWLIGPPIPVAWWAAAVAASALGLPLLFAVLGRDGERLVALSWPALAIRWVLPFLGFHLLWVAADLVVLSRFTGGIAAVVVRDTRELLTTVALPPAELSLLYCLALAPPVAKLTRRLPTWAVLGGLAVVAVATYGSSPAVGLLFLLAGLRLRAPLERLAGAATWPRLALLAGVFLAVVATSTVLGTNLPAGVRLVVTGAAAVPFGVTAAALLGRRLPEAVGRSAVLGCVLLVPFTAVVNDVVLPRLSTAGGLVQLAAALGEPIVLTAGVVLGGVLVSAAGSRLREKVGAR